MRFVPPTVSDRALQDALRQLAMFADRMADKILAPGEAPGRGDKSPSFWLMSGTHGSFTVNADNARVVGAPGTIINSTMLCTTNMTIEGIVFDGTKAATLAPLVLIGATATVNFIGCTFLRPAQLGDHVLVTSGGKAHFYGCTFGPAMPATAVPINNPGAPANVSVHGGSNKTGQAHVNVTNFGETT